MKTEMTRRRICGQQAAWRWRAWQLILPLFFSAVPALQAQVPFPSGGGTNSSPWLDSWSFNDTSGWTSDLGYAPVSFTNITWTWQGEWTALMVDSTNAAWLQYTVTESSGTNNLAVDQGTVILWFAPAS